MGAIGDPSQLDTTQIWGSKRGTTGTGKLPVMSGSKRKPKPRSVRKKKAPASPPANGQPGGRAAELTVERKVLAELKPMPVNPRVELRPGMPHYENLKHSIERHGFVDPLVWNRRTGHLVGGWQRRAVLMGLGYTKADVSVVDVDEDQERELNIVLNGVSGEWDYQALAIELETYDDATALGFSAEELDAIYDAAGLGDAGEGKGDGFDDIDRSLAGLSGTEDYAIVVTVPVEHADSIKEWLSNGDFDTAAGRGRGVMKRCGLL